MYVYKKGVMLNQYFCTVGIIAPTFSTPGTIDTVDTPGTMHRHHGHCIHHRHHIDIRYTTDNIVNSVDPYMEEK